MIKRGKKHSAGDISIKRYRVLATLDTSIFLSKIRFLFKKSIWTLNKFEDRAEEKDGELSYRILEKETVE